MLTVIIQTFMHRFVRLFMERISASQQKVSDGFRSGNVVEHI